MLPLRTRLRRRLEAEFDVIARHPFAAPADIALAADGREIRFVWNDPFWIGFTLDHAVQQVRIVSLTRENPCTL
jgi:hypothetical protein